MSDFNKAFEKIKKSEGGYVNNKHDSGGETYMGISRKYNKDSHIWFIIDAIKSEYPKATNKELTNLISKNLSVETCVKEIYKNKYWDSIRLSEIINDDIAYQLFDHGVNAGIKTSVKLMQKVFGIKETGVVDDEFIKLCNNEK